MKTRSPSLMALTLAALLALAPAGLAQAQQTQRADSLQQLADSLQQTAQQLQQTAQQLEQTAQRLQQMNVRMQRQRTNMQQAQQGRQQTSDTTQLANVPADTSGRVAQQQAGDPQGDLDATLVFFEQDPTGADPVMAVGNLDGWIQTLRATDDQELVSLASDLEELKGELQKQTIVGQRVGQLLSQIGGKTTQAASKADERGVSDKIRRLGERLSSAGEELSSGRTSGSMQQRSDTSMQRDTTRMQQGTRVQRDTTMQRDTMMQTQRDTTMQMQRDTTSMEQDTTMQVQQDTTSQQGTGGQAANRSQQQADLNATLVAFEQDVTGLDPVMAVGNIDGWIKALRAADGQQLKGIADDLEELRSELQKSSIDGQKVGQLLNTLGEKTTQAASKADPALSPQLLQLGSLLLDAGKQLSGEQTQGGDKG